MESGQTSPRLAGRVAVVTGAGNGVGKACALELARHGAAVVVNDLGTDEFGQGHTSAAADATVAEIVAAGGRASAHYESVAESAGCASLVDQGVRDFGQVDIVVGCAGAIIDATLAATDEQYRRFIDLFLSQKFWLARAAVPAMAERGWGRLITTTSHGALGVLGQPIFAGAMGGVISMTKAIAHEYLSAGVTANCLAPGAATRLHAVSHDLFQQLHRDGQITDADWDGYLNTPPPSHLAPIVAWLCSDAARDVSGEVLHAQGNLIGRWSPYTEDKVLYSGDHRTTAPWTLDALDSLVPKVLLGEGALRMRVLFG
jgi:NAD(P)-dependent dehydrogenase (short-subunit alcohol dehydrogenase family)